MPHTITTTDELAAYCARAATQPYVTVDTEFLRERTYFAQLCLVQVAMPGTDDTDAVLIDPLAEGLSLEPLYELFRNVNVVKVFHAARQDLEIFFVEGGLVPTPLFDTQVAAMVCGFGDQVGYETLVRRIAKANLDKSSRFTDWSRRPLSDAQKVYALADVTYLREIYEYLSAELARTDRTHWLEEELAQLTNADAYVVDPENAWKRLKLRSNSGRVVAIAQQLAAFRETYAQEKNVPRNRVLKDDALLELAGTKPKTVADLGKSRLLLRDARKGAIAEGLVAAVARGMSVPNSEIPKVQAGRDRSNLNPALADLLRVLLKAKAENAGVATKLIASSSDLDDIASGFTDGVWASGWRSEVFGADALRLLNGEVALAAKGQKVKIVEV
ncbi:ribonuclease D [Jannaschia sp. CCS1]|uniref:Ribonuclease D n=1 Tax=Jannaschia sp. (strain CCS1) TaxID=290400 RepID=RND_JANSC|nr:ribonuclease D [Jannaschia sp. CCS1]Q28RA7.1 RecName: Full=Ribonuclease D; Short=RNase D [Jannaschia sp. CCS1]ABD54755.1 ribonuclease D [Jannaschia sp. CCS1]